MAAAKQRHMAGHDAIQRVSCLIGCSPAPTMMAEYDLPFLDSAELQIRAVCPRARLCGRGGCQSSPTAMRARACRRQGHFLARVRLVANHVIP